MHETTTQDDVALLQEYAASGSAPAFAQVVARHADFVFATALRHTRSRDLAEDVTQAVFIVLARRARQIRPDASVAAFLHQTTLYAAKNAMRAESRRRHHERQAAVDVATKQAMKHSDDNAVAIDSALHRLRDGDRDFLMLHYFEGLTMEEVARKLNIAHEAARKRLHRALARLRAQLTLDDAGIIASIQALAHPTTSTNAAAITSTAVAGGVDGGAFHLANGVMRTFKLLALQKVAAIVLTTALVATTTVVVVNHAVSKPPPQRAATTVPAARRPLATADIIDYDRVFTEMRHTMDERARLEKQRSDATTQVSDKTRALGELRKARDTQAPDSPEYQQANQKLTAATAELGRWQQRQQYEMASQQNGTLVAIFREIEDAVTRVAAADGVTIPAMKMPPLPNDRTPMSANELRATLSDRRIPRPPGAPDLTDKVLQLLNREYSANRPRPASMPAIVVADNSRLRFQGVATSRLVMPATRATQPVGKPAPGEYLIDYDFVFNRMRHTVEARTRMYQEMDDAQRAIEQPEREKRQLQRQLDDTPKDSPEYRETDAKLKAVIAERDRLPREMKSALPRKQKQLVVELFNEIEEAAHRVAAAEGVKLPASTPPTVPENLEPFSVQQVRELMNRRRLPRVEGVPDLSEKVLDLLNREYEAKHPTTNPKPN